ncbi:MAG: cyclic nucleotide-binding domain-containing protein [Anaerolineales bacterium]|jgi:CRP-like cAMP-binding protein
MISPESLRKYPYFAGISSDCLKSVALLSEEQSFKAGDVLFEESGEFIGEAKLYEKGAEAEYLILLVSGEVDLTNKLGSGDPVVIGSVVGGDLLSLSALIPPYHLTATAVAKKDGKAIQIKAEELRALLNANPELGYHLYQGVASALMDRLKDTRVELAACQS